MKMERNFLKWMIIRREALSLDARRGHDGEGRLSRDLEEGFRDDSDDETNANQAERLAQ